MSSILLVAALMFALAGSVHAQQRPRVGVGVQLLGGIGGSVEESIGPGVRFRVSTPINQDVSLAVGSGITGYIFGGRDDAAYALDPQASAVVTFSAAGPESNYALGGVGAYVPFGDTDANSGPTFHLGAGKVWLLNESSMFLEFEPAVLVGQESTSLLLPIRAGVIF